MSKYLYTLVLFSATVVGFASPAFAGDIAIKTEMKPTMVEESSATEMPEARIIATRTEAESDNMTNLLKLTALGFVAIAFTACTTTGNIERNAAGGAFLGAAAGAAIGAVSGDVKVSEGAAAGAAIGGTAGAIRGSNQDARINGGTSARPNLDKTTRYYDDNTGRYYYYEMGTSRTFYENYERRS